MALSDKYIGFKVTCHVCEGEGHVSIDRYITQSENSYMQCEVCDGRGWSRKHYPIEIIDEDTLEVRGGDTEYE